jgi:hypothetical protein
MSDNEPMLTIEMADALRRQILFLGIPRDEAAKLWGITNNNVRLLVPCEGGTIGPDSECAETNPHSFAPDRTPDNDGISPQDPV